MVKDSSSEGTSPQAPKEAGVTSAGSLSAAGRDRMQGVAESDAPLDQSDPALMTMDSEKFHPDTRAALEAQGLDAGSVAGDKSGKKAEAAAATVLEHEGIPDGAGNTEKVKRVVPGTYDGIHGDDLMGVDENRTPMPIEVKLRAEADKAVLSEHDTTQLEPEIEKARAVREAKAQGFRAELDRLGIKEPINESAGYERLVEAEAAGVLRPEYAKTTTPELAEERRRLEDDVLHLKKGAEGEEKLPVEQMDELWTQDKYLKLLRSDGGPERLLDAGVAPEYCQIENFVDGHGNLKETPLWDDILANRTTVIVSPTDDAASEKLLRQAALEKKSHRVVKISL